jgi:hypothetical protein
MDDIDQLFHDARVFIHRSLGQRSRWQKTRVVTAPSTLPHDLVDVAQYPVQEDVALKAMQRK